MRWHVNSAQGNTKTLELLWIETNGLPIEGNPVRRGFGSRDIDATVRNQLGGTVDRRWEQSGLTAEVVIPLKRMVWRTARGPSLSKSLFETARS